MLMLETPSKINLFLRIKGKMKTGYHEIETVFLPLADIVDKISVDFNSDQGIQITSNSKSIPLNSNNLCYKAACAYAQASEINPSWKIHIEKNIPVAAGMGGGSSDAAAVLILLQKKYKAITKKQLSELACSLGADVPYFLNPTPALGKGIGEKLKPITAASGLHIVVLAPMFPVSSAWAYKNCVPEKNEYTQEYPYFGNHSVPSKAKQKQVPLSGTKNGSCPVYKLDSLIEYLRTGEWQTLGKLIHNDLASSLYEKFPALKIFKQDLIEAGAINAEITGSGPTLFALANNKTKAKQIAMQINEKYKNALFCTSSKIL